MEALKEHFKNSKFPCEMEHYLPVVFSPPRDGKQLTEPLPIAGQKQQGVPNSKATDDDEIEGEDRVGASGGAKHHDMHSSSCGSSQNGGVEGVEEEEEETTQTRVAKCGSSCNHILQLPNQ